MKKVQCVTLLLVLLIGLIPQVGIAEYADFTDLNGHWAKNDVLSLTRDGVISGKAPGIFAPEANITRAEFITLVSKLTRLKAVETTPYADIAENAWFAQTISAAKAYGAIDSNLTLDGNFYPDQPITREEMTAVVVRLAEEIRGTLLTTKNDFTDMATFAAWTSDYIAKAAGAGIVTGNPDGSFNAQGNATRAEAAVIIKRFRDLLNQTPRQLEAGEYHPVYDAVIYEEDLQKMIDDAYAAGQQSISLEKGVYRLTPQGKGGHLRFENMKDFTVYGNGSTFLYQSPGAAGVIISNCENVRIENVRTDCEKLSFYQARIIAFDPDEFTIDFVVPNGYRDYFDDHAGFTDEIYIEFHDGATGDYINHNTLTFSKLDKLGNRTYRMHSATAAKTKGIKVGDYIAGGHRLSTGSSVVITDSKQCGLSDYAIWSGQVGLALTGGYGDHRFDNVRLEPGPRPLGATEDRVFSTVADAAHVSLMEVGPKISNSIFRNMGDDGFNNYGFFYRVAERIDNSEIILATKGGRKYIQEGDTLRFYTASGTFIDDSEILSVTEESGFETKVDLNIVFDANSFMPKDYYRVKLKSAVKGIEATDWVTNVSRNCSGFALKNNYYANIRSRGILIKGSDGLIEGNTIYNTGMAGILLAPELNWLESDYVRNVTVRNNTLDSNGMGYGAQASIYVSGCEGWDNENIVIEGNTIKNAGNEAMELSYIRGLTVRDNTVESRHPDSTSTVPVIYIDKVDGAEVTGNIFPAGWTEIEVSENTKNINVKQKRP